MSLNTAALIRRHMKRVPAFAMAGSMLYPLPEFPGPPDEEVVGIYRNPPPWANTIVVFTSAAIYLVEGPDTVRIDLHDIIDYETPEKKEETVGVRIRTGDGIRFIRMAGCHGDRGQYRDAFNLIMVLQVLVSLRKRSRT
jgi:hypothetical protein